MLNLNDLHFFVQAVDSGGFAAAARRLGVPKSTVSKRVAELEAAVGARLLHRTSRSFALTDLGRDFYDHARGAMIEAEAAESVVRRRLAVPSGTVRLTTSVPVAHDFLADRIAGLATRLPAVQLQLHVTDRFVDLIQEGFDIAVRNHFAPLPDSDLVQRRLAAQRFVLVASPAYLAEAGVPEEPAALAWHRALLANPASSPWRLTGPDGAVVTVAPQPRLYADDGAVLLKAASAGLGIVNLPERAVAGAVAEGVLVPVLPGWSSGTILTTILTPHRRGQLPAVRAVIDFLAEGAGDEGL